MALTQLLRPANPHFPDHVLIKRSARARRMSLRLDPQNRVFHLTIPKGTSLRRAQRFAEENEYWMQERLRELAPPITFCHGAKIPILGRKTRIGIYRAANLKTTSIILKNNELLVFTNLDDPSPRIKRYLKQLARERICALAHEKARQIRKRINKIHIRDTRTRWGSCSEDGNLNFSWRLIFAPYESLDYVVAHEVAHLKHLDHSKSFWSVCRSLSDDFVEGHYWMQNHGHELMRYG